ncbi:hypothetical protein CXB51_005386 [Gossypium anomalum]|uniref:CCHC-type domain-containing protein n=1 Tax=Gossypium anomalum TaxID=47600 RepID=A0A8J5ZC13_9ROSI|nr:hypothetical protein CXB51_005386 [Gossypium anomalum]
MDKDFELKDWDVVMEFVNGIPSLTFTDWVSQFIDRKMSLTVIVKLLGRRIGFNALHNRVSTSWNLKNRFQLIDLENDFFLVRFQNKDDLDWVIFGGPWVIFGHYLFVRPWASTFWINNDGQLGCVDSFTWIVRGILFKLPTQGNWTISWIGRQTGYSYGCGTKGKRVQYESLPNVCFKCGTYGHGSDLCVGGSTVPKECATVGGDSSVEREVVQNQMLVEHQQRGRGRGISETSGGFNDGGQGGSRFSVVDSEEASSTSPFVFVHQRQSLLLILDVLLLLGCACYQQEDNAHDSCILSDALSRPGGLRIPEGKYYLPDAGYGTRNGYITPYRGVRYHLKEFSDQGPENTKEVFNLRHSSLQIAIERVFGILKKQFHVLDAEPFWNFQIQVDIVLACCIIHNHIMRVDPSELLNQGLYEELEPDLIIPTLTEQQEREEASE